MLVANSFDLWQKDTFFSAAEEVQQSVDIMESAYRTWHRARKEGSTPPRHLDELGRELQMALGTAKWQLEEFERAVRMSYRSHWDDITISRHTQFVSAIGDRISLIETSFKESFNENGKKPFRWVNLDEKECEDLALFLSGTLEKTQRVSDEKIDIRGNSTFDSQTSSHVQMLNQTGFPKIVPINEDSSRDESRGDDFTYQGDRMAGSRRTWDSPKKGTLKIIIDGDSRERNYSLIEGTSRDKGSRFWFWSTGGEEHSGSKGVVPGHSQSGMFGWMNQQLRGVHRNQRPQQVSTMSPVSSMRFILALMLTIFLVVPFLVYST